MVRGGANISLQVVLGAGEMRQGMLFADAFTELQEDVLRLADGSRTVRSIATTLAKPREKVLSVARKLHYDGYLRVLSAEEVLPRCEAVVAAGRYDDAISLYLYVLAAQESNLEVMLALAELYVKTAHAKDAAGLYSTLAHYYFQESRLGEALVVLRKAAGLQPGNFKVQDDLARLCVRTGRDEEAGRIWRNYALRLAGAGEYEEGLKIVDMAVAEVGSSDILLLTEAEILALMEGKGKEQRIEIPESEAFEVEFQEQTISGAGLAEFSPVQLLSVEDFAETVDTAQDFAAGTSENEEYSPITNQEEGAEYIALKSRDYYKTGADFQSFGRGWRILVVVGGFILLLLVLAGINYYYRSRMYSAVLESRGIGSLLESASLLGKVEISGEALKVLKDNAPPFAFMQSSEYRNQLARIEELAQGFIDEFYKNNVAFDQALEAWELEHTAPLAAKFLEFSASEDIEPSRRLEAEKIYAEWTQERAEREREVNGYIQTLADTAAAPEVRFKAYSELLRRFSYVFAQDYPQGVRDLTVPSRVRAEIAGTSTPVELSLTGAKRRGDGLWEIPVNPEAPVFIQHRGYTLGLEQTAREQSPMPYPLTAVQLFVLNKLPLVDLPLTCDFIVEQAEVLAQSNLLLLASRTEYMLVDTGQGKLGVGELAGHEPEAKSVGLRLFARGEWAGILSDGRVYVVSLAEGSGYVCRPLSYSAEGDVLFATLLDLELGNYDGVGVLQTRYFTGKNPAGIPPLELLAVADGARIWTYNPLLTTLYKSIHEPLVFAGRVDWYYLLVGESGAVKLIMENGDLVRDFTIELEPGSRLESTNVALLHTAGEEYLYVQGRIFQLDLQAEPELREIWRVEAQGVKKIVAGDSVILEYGAGMIRVYQVANGEKVAEYPYSGVLRGEPLLRAGRVYFVAGNEGDRECTLYAYPAYDSKPLWSYQMHTGARLLCGGESMIYLLTDQGRLLGFER